MPFQVQYLDNDPSQEFIQKVSDDNSKSLTDLYLNDGATPKDTGLPSPKGSLTDYYLNSDIVTPKVPAIVEPSVVTTAAKEGFAGLKKGLMNVINSAGEGIGAIDESVNEGGKKRNDAFRNRVDQENKDFKDKYGDSTAANIGETVGGIIGTAPLVPGKAIEGANLLSGALPTITSTGEKILAPMANRLLGSVGSGAIGGGTFALGTSAASDQPIGDTLAQGMIGGALAGPVVYGAGKLGAHAIPSAWANVDFGKLANSSKLPISSLRNIVDVLDQAGMTPQDAQSALIKMGPKATLMDLSNSLTEEGNGLAALGGKPTTILKNRLETRAATANDNIVNQVKNTLGPKPDMNLNRGILQGPEVDAIQKAAQKEAGPYYKAAKSSGATLDTSPIVNDIDNSLKSALPSGGKASVLNLAKKFLVKDDGSLRNDISSLHEARMEIDDALSSTNPQQSAGKNAKRELSNIRDKIDDLLKTNSDFKAGDIKFAEKMKVKEGLKLGIDAIQKGMTKEQFERAFTNASADTREAIKKGMSWATYESLERSGQGEQSGAQRLFGKKDINRSNFKFAYGSKADAILDEIEKATAFRHTENKIMHGSDTAIRTAIREKYAALPSGNGLLSDLTQGISFDALGAHGLGTIGAIAKRVGGNAVVRYSANRLGAFQEGSADILSQQGKEISKTLDTLDKIKRVNDRLTKYIRSNSDLKLPVISGAAGNKAYSEYKNLGK